MRKADADELVTTSVMLQRAQLQALATLAALERRSKSFVLRALLDRALEATRFSAGRRVRPNDTTGA